MIPAPPTDRPVPLPVLGDNYAWCFSTGPRRVAVVDPGEPAPVRAAVEAWGVEISHVLLTHHHPDHVAGTPGLGAGPEVVGAAADAHRLPPLDRPVADGDTLDLGSVRVSVMAVPGHTTGHVAYVAQGALFSGDALFSFGCGRLFEGTPAQAWDSLLRLRGLPDGTLLCCGHEYTLQNLAFARHLLPDDARLEQAGQRARECRARGEPTLPAPLEREKRANPFLRCDEAALSRVVGREGAPPAEVFAEIRRRKDGFTGP